MRVNDSCIAHFLQPGVKSVFNNTGHKAEGPNCKVTLLCSLEELFYEIGIIPVDKQFFPPHVFFFDLTQLLTTWKPYCVTSLWLTTAFWTDLTH